MHVLWFLELLNDYKHLMPCLTSIVAILAGGIAVMIALFGHRYFRTTPLFIAAVITVVLQALTCAGRRFPSAFVAVHVLLWALACAVYAKLTPTVPPRRVPIEDEIGTVGVPKLGVPTIWTHFKKYYVFVTSACARRPYEAAHVERRRRER